MAQSKNLRTLLRSKIRNYRPKKCKTLDEGSNSMPNQKKSPIPSSSNTQTMFPQILSIHYGSKERLEKKLETILGIDNFRVSKRISNQWNIDVARRLEPNEIADIETCMKAHYIPTR